LTHAFTAPITDALPGALRERIEAEVRGRVAAALERAEAA